MVDSRRTTPRLLRRRRRGRRPLLDIPRRPLRTGPFTQLVYSWIFCVIISYIIIMEYTELECTSNFSFLRGASHPEELVSHAASLGYTEIGITDRNSLAGIVRAHSTAKTLGIRLLPAARLDLVDGYSLLAYPTNINGYTQLSGLLTTGNLREEKGKCKLYKADVYEQLKDIRLIAIPPTSLNAEFEFDPSFEKNIIEYREVFGDKLYLAATRRYLGDDAKQIFRLSQISKRLNIPLLATNDVHYHNPERRQLQDVLTCIREKCTIQNAGYKLHQNAERHLKDQSEMKRLFLHYPEAIRATQEIVEACQFSLSELKYVCLLYTSPSPRDGLLSRMPSSA